MKDNIVNLFLDYDGVLFDWWYEGEYWKPGYYENLGARKALHEAVKELDGTTLESGRTIRCFGLSSYLTDLVYDPVEEKDAAMDREQTIPKERRIYLPCGESKWQKVVDLGLSDNAILVDDYGVNIRDWQGPYIKVSKDAEDMADESRRHTYCLSPDSTKEEVKKTILLAINEISA